MRNSFYRHFGVVIVHKINVTIDDKCEIHFNNPNRIHCHKIMGINEFAQKPWDPSNRELEKKNANVKKTKE